LTFLTCVHMCHTYFLKNKNRINTETLREPQWFTSTPKPFMMNTGQQTAQPSSHSHPTKSQLNVGYLPPRHLLFCVQPSRMTVALLMYVATAAAAHVPRAPPLQPHLSPRRAQAMHKRRARCVAGFACGLHQLAGCRRGSLMDGWASCGTRAHSPGAKKTSRFSSFCRL
jgi:hypothetical protein